MFVLIIRGWNCEKYLDECMRSLENQSCQDWRAHIVIDKSQDKSYAKALSYANARVQVTHMDSRMGVGYNMYHGIIWAKPKPDDIVGIIDADDWLYPYALSVVKRVYDVKKCLVTYGSFELMSHEKSRICKPYKKSDNVRTAKWRASHFKTFKGSLAIRLNSGCFKRGDDFIPAASDLALMMPIMEMAGMDRCRHISKVLYHYRNKTEFSNSRDKQRKYEKIIRAKKPFRRIGIA